VNKCELCCIIKSKLVCETDLRYFNSKSHQSSMAVLYFTLITESPSKT